jgi:predicted ATPase/class 3 adenylate cyclase
VSRLPTGTVTFLFTDIEGSTRLLHELGAERYAEALAEHRRLLRAAFARHGGVEVDTQGDAFFVAFARASDAVAAAEEGQQALAAAAVRVRMGLHTGEPLATEEGYVGADVHRAARIAAAGHGGQVVLSRTTCDLVESNVRDLGDHRLKDLGEPVRLFQLGHDEFPRLASLNDTNLPVQPTPFLGRERELAEVIGLVANREVRLLTLTGAGGSGKTRLALQVAAELLERFPDGVWWVPLQAVRDPDLVPTTIAQVVGAGGDLLAHLADKRSLLLLLDNAEQVIEAAPALAGILAACPNLRLLVTSREPLHLSAEHEYVVSPLVDEEAVSFFRVRALAARPDFAPNGEVLEICRRLDNLPLALELAAARVKVLSTAQILSRLGRRLPLLTGGPRDAPERQRTLHATIAWSYELLDGREQDLFAGLSVFEGGWTLEAAEDVCDAGVDELQSLVEKNLVRVQEDRFWMLGTIHDFALEQLDARSHAAELRRRHAEHFLELAERAEPELRENRQTDWLALLERERDNLRTALAWARDCGEAEIELRLATALRFFWHVRGPVAEARR